MISCPRAECGSVVNREAFLNLVLENRIIPAASSWLSADLMSVGAMGGPRVSELLNIRGASVDIDAELRDVCNRLAKGVVRAVMEMPSGRMDKVGVLEAIGKATEECLAERPELAAVMRARLIGLSDRLMELPALGQVSIRGIVAEPSFAAEGMVGGRSPRFAKLVDNLEKAAACELPVCLWGESGTGKEVMARRLHSLSPRRNGPFQAVNCAALSETLLEAELFGSVRGAYTGADRPRKGHIKAAGGGTLFLDEINESTPQLQKKLLRVLEEMAVTPVGSERAEGVDFRLISASSQNLEDLAGRGLFNEALLYRIEVLPLRLPPLRERKEDLPDLVEHFRQQACRSVGCDRRFSQEAIEVMKAYQWPGNVRQLRNVVQRCVALAGGEEILPADLPQKLRHGDPDNLAATFAELLKGLEGIAQSRKPTLARLLAQYNGRAVYNRDLREEMGVSDSTAKNILRALADAGIVEIHGKRGGRSYLVCELT